MKRVIFKSIALLTLSLTLLSCSESGGDAGASPSGGDNTIAIGTAEISSRTDGGDIITGDTSGDVDEKVSIFEAGDQITVVGAAESAVTFTLSTEGEWITTNPYEWVESPGVVKAYYGSGASISDGDQMPDFYFAEYDCEGSVPADGKLSFSDDGSFKHTAALIRVEVVNLSTTIPPTVVLNNLHQISYVNMDGTYQTDSSSIKYIDFDMTASEGANYTFEAKIPSGEDVLLADYQLRVKDENVFNYVTNTNLIPTSYEANKVYTYTVEYLDE